MAPTARTLKIATAGLGRMGARHALNLLTRTPRAELVAAFSPDPKELDWARTTLEPRGVKLYSDYDEMLKHEGLEAVLIATVTSVHAEFSIKAMEKNLHVLVEKPLSIDLAVVSRKKGRTRTRTLLTRLLQSETVVAEARKRPHLKVMCGFSRRFDASYRDAFSMIEQGKIGRPSVLRSQTCDKHDPSGFFVQYASKSGGIFVDCNVHDIDLTLWFFGGDVMPKNISAYGITAVHPELRESNDRDNAVGVVEFWSGQIAYYYSSRMMAHGQEDVTEIIGTEGKVTVNTHPAKNLVNLCHPGGITRQMPANYYDRFEYAFVNEANEFTASCLDDTPVPLEIGLGHKALQLGTWLQESLISGKPISFNEKGERIEQPRL